MPQAVVQALAQVHALQGGDGRLAPMLLALVDLEPAIEGGEHDGEQRAGLTATAVCSVTADPPRLVVFVNKNVVASQVILNSGALCVNVLAGEQEDVAKAFAGMVEGVHGDARFDYGQWRELSTGAPTLDDTLANFDCRVIKVFDESTHHAFLCEVLATRERNDGEALIYLNGGFRRIPQ